MKYSLAIILSFICASIMAQQTPTTYPFPKPLPTTGNTPNTVSRLSLSIAPSTYSNDQPAVWAPMVGGGWHSVLNSTERFASTHWNIEGSILFDASDKVYYGSGLDRVASIPLFNQSGVWLGPGPNIYTIDGFLTGQRNVNLNGKTLSFDGGAGAKFWIGKTNWVDEFSVHGGDINIDGLSARLDSTSYIFLGANNDLMLQSGTRGILYAPQIILRATNDLFVLTPGVIAGTRSVGQVLTLIDGAGHAEYQAQTGGGGTGGSGATTGTGTLSGSLYTVTSPNPAYIATTIYPDFFALDMRPGASGAGGEQLKVGSGPTKPIKTPNLSTTYNSDIVSNSIARLVFSSAADSWILNNPASTLAFDSATLSANTTNGVTTIAVLGGGVTNILASQHKFTNAMSFVYGDAALAIGKEAKLGPLWFVRRGNLQRNYPNIMFEFNSWGVTSTSADTGAWASSGGTGTVAGIGGTSGHAGILTINTAVGTNTWGGWGWRADAIDFEAGNKLYIFARVRIPTLSVSGGEAFKFCIGFGDTTTSVLLDTDCINISYSADGPESGQWTLDCGAAATHTTQTSGVSVVANQWYDLEIEATSTSVEWWVDGVQKTSITSANIPTAANKFGPVFRITSYNGGGATAHVAHLDSFNGWGAYTF